MKTIIQFHPSYWQRHKKQLCLVLFGIISELIYLLFLRNPEIQKNVYYFLMAQTGLFAVFFLASWSIARKDNDPETINPEKNRFLLVILVFMALLFRLSILDTLPIFDDDIWRYLWDGLVGSKGINPYAFEPGHPSLIDLRPSYFDKIGFKHIPTIYPPVAQIFFQWVNFMGGGTLLGMKIGVFIFDVGTIFILWSILAHLKMDPAFLIFYAWNPLVIKEFANSGHMDSLPIFMLSLAVLLFLKNKKIPCYLVLSLSVWSKFFPIFIAPILLGVSLAGWLTLILTGLFFYLPFLDLPIESIFQGLSTYHQYWRFNPGPFDLLYYCFNLFSGSITSAKYLLYITLTGLSIFLAIKSAYKNQIQKIYYCFWIIATVIITSPVVDPWYVCWVVPFLVIFSSPPWLSFCWLVNLSYLFWVQNQDMIAWRYGEYALFFLLFLCCHYSRNRKISYPSNSRDKVIFRN